MLLWEREERSEKMDLKIVAHKLHTLLLLTTDSHISPCLWWKLWTTITLGVNQCARNFTPLSIVISSYGNHITSSRPLCRTFARVSLENKATPFIIIIIVIIMLTSNNNATSRTRSTERRREREWEKNMYEEQSHRVLRRRVCVHFEHCIFYVARKTRTLCCIMNRWVSLWACVWTTQHFRRFFSMVSFVFKQV